MKDETLHPWIEPELEARIVALVVGEASDFETEELERLIEEKPELALFRQRMESLHGMLKSNGKTESISDAEDWKLSTDKRDNVLAVLGGEPAVPAESGEARKISKPARRRVLPFLLKVAAVVALLAAFFGALMPASAPMMSRQSKNSGSMKSETIAFTAGSIESYDRAGALFESTDDLVVSATTASSLDLDTDRILSAVPKVVGGGEVAAAAEVDVSRYAMVADGGIIVEGIVPGQAIAGNSDVTVTSGGQIEVRQDGEKPAALTDSLAASNIEVEDTSDRPSAAELSTAASSMEMELTRESEGKVERRFAGEKPVAVTDSFAAIALNEQQHNERARMNYYDSSNDHTRSKMLAQVAEGWESPVPDAAKLKNDQNSSVTTFDYIQAPNLLDPTGGETPVSGAAKESDGIVRLNDREVDVWFGATEEKAGDLMEVSGKLSRVDNYANYRAKKSNFGLEKGAAAAPKPSKPAGGNADSLQMLSAEAAPAKKEVQEPGFDSKIQSDDLKFPEEPASPIYNSGLLAGGGGGGGARDWGESVQSRGQAAQAGVGGEISAGYMTDYAFSESDKKGIADNMSRGGRVAPEPEKSLARNFSSGGTIVVGDDVLGENESGHIVVDTSGRKQGGTVRIGGGFVGSESKDRGRIHIGATASDEDFEIEERDGLGVKKPKDVNGVEREQIVKQKEMPAIIAKPVAAAQADSPAGPVAGRRPVVISKAATHSKGFEQLGVGGYTAARGFEHLHDTDAQPEERFLKKKRKLIREIPSDLTESSAEEVPFSTFSLHVSDVSFKLAQAALAKGEWPEAERIRIEEFVNAFDYGDPMPAQEDKVAAALEQAIHPFLQQRNLLRVSMRTAATGRNSSTPLRLTFLLDNSGSMERTDRKATVQKAFAMLASMLRPNDQVTLISFARQPRLLADRVSGEKASQLVETVMNLPSEGGTNLEAAIDLAFEKATEQKGEGAQNRIILLTDGAANLGDAEPERLAAKIEQMRDAGIAFDAAGIGTEGLNDEILEALTRKGDGRYYLLEEANDVDAGFARQIAGALRPAAGNVKVQIEFNPERVGKYKLLGFEKHRLKKEDFRNDKVDAAELAAAEAGVAVYQVEAKSDGKGDIGYAFVRFRDMSTGEMTERRWTIPYLSHPARPEQATPSMQVATVATMLGAKLKGGVLGDVVDLGELLSIVSELPEQWREKPRVVELKKMLESARAIVGN